VHDQRWRARRLLPHHRQGQLLRHRRGSLLLLQSRRRLPGGLRRERGLRRLCGVRGDRRHRLRRPRHLRLPAVARQCRTVGADLTVAIIGMRWWSVHASRQAIVQHGGGTDHGRQTLRYAGSLARYARPAAGRPGPVRRGADSCDGATIVCGEECACYATMRGQTRCGGNTGLSAECGDCANDDDCVALFPAVPGVFCARSTTAICGCDGTGFCAAPCPA
jgi:hypothetical protein